MFSRRTSLHSKTLERHLPKTISLLLHAGADPNRDSSYLPLFCINHHLDLTSLLLAHGADPDLGHHYVWKYSPYIPDEDYNYILLKSGADPNSRIVHDEQFKSYTFLMLCAYCGNSINSTERHKNLERIEMFLNDGADRTMKNLAGQTAADIARSKGYYEIADLLSKPRKIL